MPCLTMSEQLGCHRGREWERNRRRRFFPSFGSCPDLIQAELFPQQTSALPIKGQIRPPLPQRERILQTIFVFMTHNIWINMLIWRTDSHHKSAKPQRIHILKFTLYIYTNKSTQISVYNTPYWFKLATGLPAALALGLIDLWENKYLFTQSAVFSIVSCSPMERV